MSKKSRKRNKKILGALAAGLGAMALMKGRRGEISSNRPSGIDAPMITGDVVDTQPVPVKVSNKNSNFQTRFTSNRNPKGVYMGPNETRLYNANLFQVPE
jgi:hypothetical protein